MADSIKVPQLFSDQLESLYSTFVQNRSKTYKEIHKATDEWFYFYKNKANAKEFEELSNIKQDHVTKLETLQRQRIGLTINDFFQLYKNKHSEYGSFDYLMGVVDFFIEFFDRNFSQERSEFYHYTEDKINSFVFMFFFKDKLKNIVEYTKETVNNVQKRVRTNKSHDDSRSNSNVFFNLQDQSDRISLDLNNLHNSTHRLVTESNDMVLTDCHNPVPKSESNVTLNRLKALGLRDLEIRSRLEENLSQNDFMRKTCENLEISRHDLDIKLRQMEVRYNKVKNELFKEKGENLKSVKKIESLTMETKMLLEENKELKEKVNSANSKLCNLFTEIEKLKDIKEKYLSLQSNYNIENVRNQTKLNEALDSIKNIAIKEKQELMKRYEETLLQEREKNKNNIEEVRKEYSAKLHKLNTEVCVLSNKNENLLRELDELYKRDKEHFTRIKELENKLDSIRSTDAKVILLTNKSEENVMNSIKASYLKTESNIGFKLNEVAAIKPKKFKSDSKKLKPDKSKKSVKVSKLSKFAQNSRFSKTGVENKTVNKKKTGKQSKSKTKKDDTMIRKRAKSLKKINKELETMHKVINMINKRVSVKNIGKRKQSKPGYTNMFMNHK